MPKDSSEKKNHSCEPPCMKPNEYRRVMTDFLGVFTYIALETLLFIFSTPKSLILSISHLKLPNTSKYDLPSFPVVPRRSSGCRRVRTVYSLDSCLQFRRAWTNFSRAPSSLSRHLRLSLPVFHSFVRADSVLSSCLGFLCIVFELGLSLYFAVLCTQNTVG